jgi:hypothetical protein
MRNILFFAFILAVVFIFVNPLPASAACALQTSTGSVTLTTGDICSISGLVGLDNGSTQNTATLTLPASTSLTINNGATLVAGSLHFTGGTTSIQSGGKIKPGSTSYLYATDADGDHYPASTTFSTSAGTNMVRIGTLLSLTTADCYDSNASAYPGQTAYFTTNRGDGSFDYNCDSSINNNVGTTYTTCSTAICTYSTIIQATCNVQNTTPGCGGTFTGEYMTGGYSQNTCYTASKGQIVTDYGGTVGCN